MYSGKLRNKKVTRKSKKLKQISIRIDIIMVVVGLNMLRVRTIMYISRLALGWEALLTLI